MTGVEVDDLRFLLGGEIILDSHTPLDLELDNQEQIYVTPALSGC
jgi:hypothetical protein